MVLRTEYFWFIELCQVIAGSINSFEIEHQKKVTNITFSCATAWKQYFYVMA